MNGGTPISQLRPEMQDQQKLGSNMQDGTLSYQDVLKDLEKKEATSIRINEDIHPQQMQPPQQQMQPPQQQMQPPHQQMQQYQQMQPPQFDIDRPQYRQELSYGNAQTHNRQIGQKQVISGKNGYELFSDKMQHDIALILIVYVLLHSTFFQKIIKDKFPNMYTENTPTTFGLVFHAVLIVTFIYIGKIVKNKFT